MYSGNHFIKVRNDIFDYGLSSRAIALYVYLSGLQYRYQDKKAGNKTFYRTDRALSHDLRWKPNTLERARRELTDSELIEASVQPLENGTGDIAFYKIL